MNILFTICARAGSKGLKNKNISFFLDQPLCYYTLSAYDLFCSANPQYKCTLAVNTDSEELINQIKQTNIEFNYVERITELSGDTAGKLDVIKDTYKKISSNFDFIMDLDLTSPLRTVKDIDGVLTALIDKEDADGAFSMTHSRRSPYFNQVKKNNDGFYSTVITSEALTRQQVEEVFDMNASIYAYRPSFLLNDKTKKLFNGKMVAYKMLDSVVLDIDEPQDKDLMEIIAKYFYEKYNDYKIVHENILKIKRVV